MEWCLLVPGAPGGEGAHEGHHEAPHPPVLSVCAPLVQPE